MDRLNRPPEYIRRPAIAIGISVQPEVLAGLKARPTLHGRGLLARFLYALPTSLLGRRAVQGSPLRVEVRADYERRIARLLTIEQPTDQDGRWAAHCLTFAAEAIPLFTSFCQRIELLLAPEGDLAHMSDWGGKFAGAVARIIGILHLAAHSDSAQPWAQPIRHHTVADGLVVAEYLLAHGRAAFAEMGADPAAAAAQLIREWARREQRDAFSKRDAWRALRGRFGRAADLDAPLAMLVEHGYLREQEPNPRTCRGRKPSQVYLTNPLGQDGQNGHNRSAPEERGPADADSEFGVTETDDGHKSDGHNADAICGQCDQSMPGEPNQGAPGRT